MKECWLNRIDDVLGKHFYVHYLWSDKVESAQSYLRGRKDCYSSGYQSNYEISKGGPYWAEVQRNSAESGGVYLCSGNDDTACFLLAFLMSRLLKPAPGESWVTLRHNSRTGIWVLTRNKQIIGESDDPLELLGV